jgi:hypothetical protein
MSCRPTILVATWGDGLFAVSGDERMQEIANPELCSHLLTENRIHCPGLDHGGTMPFMRA